MWLTGVLKDTLSYKEESYRLEIDAILSELYKEEADQIKRYIQQLNYDKSKKSG
jgi:hypothetical protein